MATITWKKSASNPLPALAPQPGTWREGASMTVDVVPREDHFQIFYVGKKGGQDSIGIATQPRHNFDGLSWIDYPYNPVLAPGAAGSHDSKHLVDPACVVLEGKYFLYYSAIGDGPDSIGLATSDDGIHFTKEEQPVFVGRAPEVAKVNDLIYLIYSHDTPDKGYEFHLATSPDGRHFTEQGPIFKPEGEGWDCFSVVTPRVFYENGIYVMAYAADDREKDYPKSFGLAFSPDMVHWKRYPENPILSVGPADSWEFRAMWFPEILKLEDRYYMWYEGYNGKFSQVGLAVSESPIIQIGQELLAAG